MTKRQISGIMLTIMVASLFTATGCNKLRKRNAGSETGVVTDFPGGIDDFNQSPLSSRPFGEPGVLVDIEFESVLFEYDSARIAESERAKAENVADYLRRNPDLILVIEGHCDERGSRDYNMALGERRALAARAYLIGLGVDGSRMHTKSYGEEMPVDPGHNEAAWRMNRRAEFVVYEP